MMKNNQFAIMPVSHEQKVRELAEIGFLNNSTIITDATELWMSFLHRTILTNPAPAGWNQFCHNTLATEIYTLEEFIARGLQINESVFKLVSLQLLEFEDETDFQITNPIQAWDTIQLPAINITNNSNSIIDAWYDLLCAHTKSGVQYLDLLTSQGFFVSTYSKPIDSRPRFFNGKALAVYDGSKLIREVVYVETDIDTDNDHHADLVKVEVMRPVETNNGFKVPAVYTASPYNQGTNDNWGEQRTHNVHTKLHHKSSEIHSSEPVFSEDFEYQITKGITKQTEETYTHQASYTLNNYLAVRGFAIVYSAGIGTKDSDGFQTCGSPEQTDATVAVIEWLAGKRQAFTNRTDGIAVTAWWCNQKVAMTGRSYLGTLATAAATTGTPALKTIISEAAISNWYDYYRENGLVMAPGGFSGEDADVLAAETFSRTKNVGDYSKVKQSFSDYLDSMTTSMDRNSGDYNEFWQRRNYRPNIKNITADIMMVHGLNDWNVKVNQVKSLWDELQKLPVAHKIVLHQGQHIYINAFRSIDFTDIVNLWLTNKLWDVHNGANEIIPDVIVQDNVAPETWRSFDNWSTNNPIKWQLLPHTLSKNSTSANEQQSFNDQLDEDTFRRFDQHPEQWQSELLTSKNGYSLLFKTAPVKDELILRGTPQLTLSVASSKNYGMISAQLVDFGEAKRFNISPTVLDRNGIELGHLWQKDDLREFQLASKSSPYKVISYGHINMQNRTSSDKVDDLNANELVNLTFNLQPLFHHLITGHQLGLVVFSTDFGMTIRANDDLKYTISLDTSSLKIPSFQRI